MGSVVGDPEEELFNLVLLQGGYAETSPFEHEFGREFRNAEEVARGVGPSGNLSGIVTAGSDPC